MPCLEPYARGSCTERASSVPKRYLKSQHRTCRIIRDLMCSAEEFYHSLPPVVGSWFATLCLWEWTYFHTIHSIWVQVKHIHGANEIDIRSICSTSFSLVLLRLPKIPKTPWNVMPQTGQDRRTPHWTFRQTISCLLTKWIQRTCECVRETDYWIFKYSWYLYALGWFGCRRFTLLVTCSR